MEAFILSTPFASAGMYIAVAALNLVLLQRGAQIHAAHAAKFITIEGGPFTVRVDENNPFRFQSIMLVPTLFMFTAHLLLQSYMRSEDPLEARSAAAFFLFIFGTLFITLLTNTLNNLAAIWTWKHTYSAPESTLSGKLDINRWHALKNQAHSSFFSSGVLFLLMYIFTASPLLLGGAVGGFAFARAGSKQADAIINPPQPRTPPATPRRVTAVLIFIVFFMLFWVGWIITQGINASTLLAIFWVIASLVTARGLGAPERWGPMAARFFVLGLAAMFWIERWLSGGINSAEISLPLGVTLAALGTVHFMLRGKRMDDYFSGLNKTKRKKNSS